jgi:hypothetical protein
MKQSLSVIPKKTNVTGILFSIVLVFITATAYFIWAMVSSTHAWQAQSETFEKQNAMIHNKIDNAQNDTKFVPTSSQLSSLRQRVDWYNQRIPQTLDPVLSFLTILEKSLLPDVKLNDFFYDQGGKSVAISLLSVSEQSLLATLRQLQNELAPMTLTLERQLSLDGVDLRMIQYDVRVVK